MVQIPDDKRYFRIGEASRIIGVEPYVLRYWETQFPALKPRKNRAGNRVYRVKDIKYVLTIKNLLYERGFTIAGARKKLKEASTDPSVLIEQLNIPFGDPEKRRIIISLKKDLLRLKELVESL